MNGLVWGDAVASAPFPGAELGNLTATAILGWYAWHTASRTIPGLVADFRAEMAAARSEHRADCDVFRAELAAERAARHENHLQTLEALDALSARWAEADAAIGNGEDKE